MVGETYTRHNTGACHWVFQTTIYNPSQFLLRFVHTLNYTTNQMACKYAIRKSWYIYMILNLSTFFFTNKNIYIFFFNKLSQTRTVVEWLNLTRKYYFIANDTQRCGLFCRTDFTLQENDSIWRYWLKY